jgi:hypothetical protein
MLAWLRSLANAILRKVPGKPEHLDTATPARSAAARATVASVKSVAVLAGSAVDVTFAWRHWGLSGEGRKRAPDRPGPRTNWAANGGGLPSRWAKRAVQSRPGRGAVPFSRATGAMSENSSGRVRCGSAIGAPPLCAYRRLPRLIQCCQSFTVVSAVGIEPATL